MGRLSPQPEWSALGARAGDWQTLPEGGVDPPGGSVMTVDRPGRPLLTVKQLIPPVRPGAVPRPELERQLRDARTPLTVVVAPAGWGKTSLLSSWASNPGDQVRVAWVSLDESDDEPTRFWSYLLSALRSAEPRTSPTPRPMPSPAPGNPSISLCRSC